VAAGHRLHHLAEVTPSLEEIFLSFTVDRPVGQSRTGSAGPDQPAAAAPDGRSEAA
jgi:hypothetical protein